MVEANDTLEPVTALDDDDDDVPEFPINDLPKTINDLPKELLVSVFIAFEDPILVMQPVPLVCKEWDEIYRSQDASPLHETLEVDLRTEVERAAAAREWAPCRGLRPITRAAAQEWALSRRVHASRVISWAERRAGSVRKLYLKGGFEGALEDFSSEDFFPSGKVEARPRRAALKIRLLADDKEKTKEKKRREHSPIRDAPPLLCPVVLLLPTENVSLPVSARRDAERESSEPQLPEYFF